MAELKIITMRDIKKEQVEWLWRPYIPCGKISIIQGDPGDGKITMALAIAAAVTRGEPLPGSVDIFAAARSVLTVGRIPVDDNMRAVVHNKSNLAPAGQSIAFGLDPVDGFCWLGDFDISIDDLLRDNKQPAENQFTKARRLLETELGAGPVPAVDMEQMAEEQGISHQTLCRAKKALGVVSEKRDGKWYWYVNEHERQFMCSSTQPRSGSSIEVEYSVVPDDGCQGCHNSPVASMARLAPLESEVV